MFDEIFNNIYAQNFFKNTVLECNYKSPNLAQKIKKTLWEYFGILLGEINLEPEKKFSNICLYSDSELLADFSFAIACAAALRGLRCAFITPTPNDYSSKQFEKLPNAPFKAAKSELMRILANLYIARSDVKLPRRGFDLAVVSPASAYEYKLQIPHILVHYHRTILESYYLVHFQTSSNSILLSSSQKQFRYYFFKPHLNSFSRDENQISDQMIDLMLRKKLPLRRNSSHADELGAFLSFANSDNFSIKCRHSCALGIKIAGALLPIDLSPQEKNFNLDFKILCKPSF